MRIVGIAISERRATSAPWSGWPRPPAGDAYLAAEPEDILEVFAQAVLSR